MKAFQNLRNALVAPLSSQPHSSGSETKQNTRRPFTDSGRRRKIFMEKPSSPVERISSPRPLTGSQPKYSSPRGTKTGSIDNARSPNVQSKLGFPCELPEDLVTDLDIQAKFEIDDKKFKLVIKRPVWNSPASRLPKGYDRAPGYNYIRGLMILYPGGNLGMNVKSYNSKVYVTNADQMSMASAACLMGDCIVDVDGIPVTSTATCGERLISGLKEKKFVLMTIERAVDAQALRVVKYVLLVEKVPEKDPRMAQDTAKIGLDEAGKIQQKSQKYLPPLKGIYRGKHGKIGKRLVIREMSMFTPIGADPFNPLLMQAVPPKKMDAMHASKSVGVRISTPFQRASSSSSSTFSATGSSSKTSY